MIQTTQHASVRWDGNLGAGSGTLSLGDGAASVLPVSWASRTGHASGKTSPEELLAAAHASCYAMTFSHILEDRGAPPEQLSVAADCTFEQVTDDFKVSQVILAVEGKVAGITDEHFADVARAAEQFCPISNAFAATWTSR